MKKSEANLIREAIFKTGDGAKGIVGFAHPQKRKTLKSGKTVNRCAAKVWGNFNYYQCYNAGSIQRGDHWFCRVCDPITKNTKREERTAAWNAKFEAEQKADRKAERIEAAERKVITVVKDVFMQMATIDDLERAVNALEKAEKDT